MSDIQDELAREIVYDHYTRPRRKGSLGEGATVLENPSCGDRLSLSLDEEEIESGCEACAVGFHFEGKGCSISQASASMMADLLSGRSREEAIGIAEAVLSVFRGDADPEVLDKYGDISALGGVARLPVRVKCAALAWQGALRLLRSG
jgi:nitrogen fixation NifU-like protein